MRREDERRAIAREKPQEKAAAERLADARSRPNPWLPNNGRDLLNPLPKKPVAVVEDDDDLPPGFPASVRGQGLR
jgi:hypothetical protein